MSSSMSPSQQGQAFGGGEPQDKGGLSSLNLNFLKNLTDRKTTRGIPGLVDMSIWQGDTGKC